MTSKLVFLFVFIVTGFAHAWCWTSSVRRSFSVNTIAHSRIRWILPLNSAPPMDDWDQSNADLDQAPSGGAENEDDRPSDEELEASLGDWDERVAKLNTLHLVGRVGNNPEPRHFDNGNVVVNLNIACKRKLHYAERKSENIKSGDEETDWFALEIWGQTAEFVSKYVDKGARVGVIGNLQVDEWQDKQSGENRTKAKVVVREFDLLESKAEADLRRSNQRGPSFYTEDDDKYNPSTGSSGGFFD